MLIHDVPLHDVVVGVWCAVNATRTVEPILIPETINSYQDI